MKLLYITNGINGSGGLERVLSIKASVLAEQYNYEIVILVLNNSHLNPFYTFSSRIKLMSFPVGGNPLRYLFMYKQGIQKVVDSFNPDIISVCDDGLKGFLIPKIIKTEARIIYERHVSKLIELQAKKKSGLQKLLARGKWALMEQLASSFSKFIVLTKGNLKEWSTLSNVMVIPNPLSFYPKESSSLQNKVVICVGKISFQKGQDLLVKAWEQVHKKHPDWQLELYGKVNDEQLLAGVDLEALNIRHFLPEKNIEERYIDSSIYVMSSRFEGFGMVLIEAMACGLPCVSFDCDYGPSDVITNNKDGYIVANGDINDLAEHICKLIDNYHLRAEMGHNARQSAKQFLPMKIVEQWDALFRSLVSR